MGDGTRGSSAYVRPAGRYFVREVGDGASLLLGPRQTAAALSPTGTDIARALLADATEADIVRQLQRSYQRVAPEAATAAVREVRDLVAAMAHGMGRYDHTDLEEPASPVFRAELDAPLAADLDLAADGDVPDEANREPLIDALAAATIPFVTFLLPPRNTGDRLPPAIERAAGLSLSPGVRGRASDIVDATVEALAAAAPSRIEIFFAEPVEDTHDRYFGAGDRDVAVDVISRCAKLGIECTALVPLTERTLPLLEDTADDLASMGCRAGAAYALVAVESGDADALAPEQLRQAAALVQELDGRDGAAWSWLPPLRRDPGLSLGYQARRGPRTVRPGAVRVGPLGAVIAGDGPADIAGRLLETPWPDIWKAPALDSLREPRQPGLCVACPFTRACERGCVADVDNFVSDAVPADDAGAA